MIDSIAVSLFVDRLSLSNQKQEATGDEGDAKQATGEEAGDRRQVMKQAERVKAVAWR